MQTLELYLWTDGKSRGHEAGYSAADVRQQLAKRGINATEVRLLEDSDFSDVPGYAIYVA
jgi:hypothetical protein